MAEDERRPLLAVNGGGRVGKLSRQDEEVESMFSDHVSIDERKMYDSTVGERLPYNDYTTIDWLHDLVKASYRLRFLESRKGIRAKLSNTFDQASGWIAAALIGALTACVAFLVDIAAATVSDWKFGYCSRSPWSSRDACCAHKTPLLLLEPELDNECPAWTRWSDSYVPTYAIYVAFALLFGLISGNVTMLTRQSLPAADPDPDKPIDSTTAKGKQMYMASGSGIPEIKTILCGFVIPNFLDLKVLCVKAIGATFAVSTGMCLGKEGPFVHISACMGDLVAKHFPKYRDNGRKRREILSAACASGLSVAFGAPIGGVLFSYEEISTYFPRRVLWKAFLCSLCAAVVLKALNPTGTGKLVLFETAYGTSYAPLHYLVFIFLGIAGGIWGGAFCRLNLYWSKWFRSFPIIKRHPVFETFLIVLATALLQYPNPLAREPGDAIIRNLLVDCRDPGVAQSSWVCQQELRSDATDWAYTGWLLYGTLIKLLLTIITFGIKVPSGVIIPALGGGAFFGRLVGQWIPTISPGVFAMVGAAAFLAGVSRMTISLCVIMFELTGELEFVVPHMLAILVAKWVADAIDVHGVYDVAQTVLGHPFLDIEACMPEVQRRGDLVETLKPPGRTMRDITVVVPASNKVPRRMLEDKLAQLKHRGLMDAGLVLVHSGGALCGYLAEGELEFGLRDLGKLYAADAEVRLFGDVEPGELDMSHFVDRTPLSVCEKAPLEYAVEMFGKLGLRHLVVTEERSGRVTGVIIKKRLVAYLDGLEHGS